MQLKSLNIIYKTYKKTKRWREENKLARDLGTQGMIQWCVPGFSF